MSQSATLYRIAKKDFSKLAEDPSSLKLVDKQTTYETFGGTHEGLKYVLSKFGDSRLANQIFYPETYIGSEVDYENMNDEMLEALNERIYYLTPEIIVEINTFLSRIQVDDFRNHFDSNELNKEGIYPWVWNDSKEENSAYNEKDITEDFKKLKSIFETSKLNGEYLLSFVG